MEFVNASVSLVPQLEGVEAMLKHIELCGRVSYKSEDRITEDSCYKFIQMLINRGHTSPCEHGTIYLTIPKTKEFSIELESMATLKYTDIVYDTENAYITTNYRVILENTVSLEFIKKYWSEPTKHIKRVSMRVICSRGVGYEAVRHRILSFTQESTRYCDYSKEKHGSHIKYIIPSWIKDLKEGDIFTVEDIAPEKVVATVWSGKYSSKTMILAGSYVTSEQAYKELLNLKCTPQEAREVLPNGLKTELIITGSIPQWEHFLSLRSPAYGAKGMHPDMAIIGDSVYNILISKGLINKPV